MAITPRGANTASTNSGTSISVTIPANAEVGDLLLVGVGHRVGSNGTITAPAGWTQLNGQLNSTTVLAAAIFQRIAEAGDAGSSVTFDSGSGSNTKITAIAQAYGHVDQANPINGSGGQVNASSVNIVTPAITAPNPSLIVNFASTATGTTIGETSGWSQSGAVSTGGGAAGSRNTSAQQSRDWSAANPGSVTAVASAAAVNIGVQIALAEAASVTHDTSGALSGQGSAVSGAAARAAGAVTHATDGVLSGPGATLAGAAARTRVHPTTGVLSGQGSTVAGAAARTRAHATTSVLTGPSSELAGAAARYRQFATAGVITGLGAVLSGVASKVRLHDASGVLSGPNAILVGAADRISSIVDHASSGALSASGSLVASSAERLRQFLSNGTLVGAAAEVEGLATRTRLHAVDGYLSGSGADVAGELERLGAPPNHATIGAINCIGASLTGSASSATARASTGAIEGSGFSISGIAARARPHGASGILHGNTPVVDGVSSNGPAPAHIYIPTPNGGVLRYPGERRVLLFSLELRSLRIPSENRYLRMSRNG